jgi:M6 family metalloprotease-like protein
MKHLLAYYPFSAYCVSGIATAILFTFVLFACDAPPAPSDPDPAALAAEVHELVFDQSATSPESEKSREAAEKAAETWTEEAREQPQVLSDVIPLEGASEAITQPIESALGYNRLRVNGVAAVGTRPLMVIMLEFSDRPFASGASVEMFDTMFFGPALPNIAAFTNATSDGTFAWSSAGVFRFISHDIPDTKYDESKWDCVVAERCNATGYSSGELLRVSAVRAAVRGGVDFRPFDVNGDGRVTQDELQLHVVEAWNTPAARGGANRTVGAANCVGLSDGSKVDICPGKVGSGTEASAIDVHAHELMHSLGVEDVYNGSCDSRGLTLMSCSDRLVFLDPWHRIQLGWTYPRYYDGATGSHCEPLATLDKPYSPHNTPLVLGYPTRGEYFLFERRARGALDRDLADEDGVAVWHLKARADGSLDRVDGEIVEPGPNSMIDTTPSGDDWTSRGADNVTRLFGGANRVVDSAVGGDDVRVRSKGMMSRGAGGLYDRPWSPGGPNLWSAASGPTELRTFGGERLGTWFAVGVNAGAHLGLAWGQGLFATATNPPVFADPDGRYGDCFLP